APRFLLLVGYPRPSLLAERPASTIRAGQPARERPRVARRGARALPDLDRVPVRAREPPRRFPLRLAPCAIAFRPGAGFVVARDRGARRRPSASPISAGISEGVRATGMPAASKAAIFSA